MARIFKAGRVVIVTSGRFAGRKAIVARQADEGNKRHRFPHLVVVGIARNAKKVTRALSKKKIIRRTNIKPFFKVINQKHVIPTRHTVADFDFKEVKEDLLHDTTKKQEALKLFRTLFSKAYRELPDPKVNEKAGHIRFFFNKLRF